MGAAARLRAVRKRVVRERGLTAFAEGTKGAIVVAVLQTTSAFALYFQQFENDLLP